MRPIGKPIMKENEKRRTLAAIKATPGRIKNSIVDKVSDVMSYPARRAAQKAMLNSDKELNFIKDARSKGMSVKRENKELIATPKQVQLNVLQSMPKKNTQRDDYAKSMARATKAGGSSGLGIGR